MNDDIDRDASHDLRLFIENDGQLYERSVVPIRRNLMTKRARGTYDSTRAVDAFKYLVEDGAKKYAREVGTGTKWSVLFSPATRRETAKELTRRFETMAKTGELDYLMSPRNPHQTPREDPRKSKAQLDREVAELTRVSNKSLTTATKIQRSQVFCTHCKHMRAVNRNGLIRDHANPLTRRACPGAGGLAENYPLTRTKKA